jgi:hypothetical protein
MAANPSKRNTIMPRRPSVQPISLLSGDNRCGVNDAGV